jgi:phosphohistidine swiveling domain-containing protein
VSSRPAHELWNLSRMICADASLRVLFEQHEGEAILRTIENDGRYAGFRAAFQRYLDEWGFRCSAELMLTVPSFQEAPAPIIELLRAYARLESGSPNDAQARQAAARERETLRLVENLAGRPLYAVALRVALTWTHAAIRFRERARLKQALLYSRCRRVALALGAQLVRRDVLDRADDIFWLTVNEVDELASGGAMFPRQTRELVSLRARAHLELAASSPPASFELSEGEYLQATNSAPRRLESDPNSVDDSRVLVGTSACGGSVTSRAAVLSDMSEAARLQRGDALVTRQTDPGWAPAFFLVSGLVVERGGMLSHGAIVAREFGIPCVVGVRGATERIQSGSTITVDGDAGRVHLA